MAKGIPRKNAPRTLCPYPGCGVSLLDNKSNIGQHVRKRHGVTLGTLQKKSVRRNPITPTKLPPMRDSSAVQIQDALLVKARGRTWIAVPIEEVFTNASS